MKTSKTITLEGEYLKAIRQYIRYIDYRVENKDFPRNGYGLYLIRGIGAILMGLVSCHLPDGDKLKIEITADNGLTD